MKRTPDTSPVIKLTRNACGVARLPLIGGRYDGGEWIAIIGAPVCIPIKPAAKGKTHDAMSTAYAHSMDALRYFRPIFAPDDEGEEWQTEATKDRPENRAQRFALYAPKIDNGKASLALYFIEEIEL